GMVATACPKNSPVGGSSTTCRRPRDPARAAARNSSGWAKRKGSRRSGARGPRNTPRGSAGSPSGARGRQLANRQSGPVPEVEPPPGRVQFEPAPYSRLPVARPDGRLDDFFGPFGRCGKKIGQQRSPTFLGKDVVLDVLDDLDGFCAIGVVQVVERD